MPRLLFEKTGDAIWMSHLDLMRLFQRGFKRAGLPLKHTQGYNPRPSVSIALPLSVGVSSRCELLDFELDGCDASNEEVLSKLNGCLVSGVKCLAVYDGGRKLRELSLLKCRITLEYTAVPHGAVEAISALFGRDALIVVKKTKNGPQQQDILPMIRHLDIRAADGGIIMDAVICCQNPSLNPMQLCLAVSEYLPELTPEFSNCCRLEIYDSEEKVFR